MLLVGDQSEYHTTRPQKAVRVRSIKSKRKGTTEMLPSKRFKMLQTAKKSNATSETERVNPFARRKGILSIGFSQYLHYVKITGLQLGTTYDYIVGDTNNNNNNVFSPIQTFTSMRSKENKTEEGRPWKFILLADLGLENDEI